METALAIIVGVLIAASVYLMLSNNVIRFLFALVMIGNAVNILIFTAGRLVKLNPPFVPHGAVAPTRVVANALPQALALTAIVISFALLSFVLTLLYKSYKAMNELDMERICHVDASDCPPENYSASPNEDIS